MSMLKKMIALIALTTMMSMPNPQIEAIAYVTDTGGYAYDESRAATNLAPAIALGTVAIVGIIAIAVQNSHGHSSSSCSSSCHSSRCCPSYCPFSCSCSSCCPSYCSYSCSYGHH